MHRNPSLIKQCLSHNINISPMAWNPLAMKGYELDIETWQLFRFLQMRHYLKTILKDVDMENLEERMMKLFISAYNSEFNIKIISRTYKCFSNIRSGDAFYIKEKWDRESNEVLTGEEWHKICQTQWKTTSSLSWREVCWKSLLYHSSAKAT